MASPQQTSPSSSTVTFLAVLTSDAGSFLTDFLTLADYQRLLCTCKTVSTIHTAAEKKKNKVKDFLLEREIVLLLNGNEHDTLTKRMIDCIRLGSNHYHVEQRGGDEAGHFNTEPGTLSDAFGWLLSEEYGNDDNMAEIENEHVVHGRCVSRFCRSATKTEQKRLYIVTNDNDSDTGTIQIRAYCRSCILDDVCLALRFFALQDIQTNMGETWCLKLKWEDASSDAFIVSCFSYEPYVSWTFYFVGGQHHASINAKETLQKELEENRASIRRLQQRAQRAAGRELFGLSDDDDDDDDTNDREENTRMHPQSKRQRTNRDLFGSSDDEE